MALQYKRIYLISGMTLIALFITLTAIGVQISSDGDKICPGTKEQPCISYITINNPTSRSIYIYNKNNVSLGFSPEISSYQLYVKYYGKWVPMNFTRETRLSNVPKDAVYNFVFPRYSTKEFMLVGYKKQPDDRVKWSLGIPGDELDPVWDAIEVKNDKHGAYFDDVDLGNGKRVLATSSGIINTFEDNKWKKLDEARSLNNSGITFKKIEEDSRYDYLIVDFNTTSITIVPILKDSKDLNIDVSIKTNDAVVDKFNYRTIDDKISYVINTNVLLSNFTIGDNSTTFQVNGTGSSGRCLSSGAGRGCTSFDTYTFSFFGTGDNNGGIWYWSRTMLNFSLAQIPSGATIISANLSMFQNADMSDIVKNFTYIIKNGTFDVMGAGDADNFTGWASGATTKYGGFNVSVMRTEQIQPAEFFNSSFTSDGVALIQERADMDKELKLMVLSELDINNSITSDAGVNQLVRVNDPFDMPPILWIEYEEAGGPANTGPGFLNGYPQLNSSTGQNFSHIALSTIFIANDTQNATFLFNVTWITNNRTNFTTTSTTYTNATLVTSSLHENNLTKGQTWRAMINVFDGEFISRKNTSELLIGNFPPGFQFNPQINSTNGLNRTSANLGVYFKPNESDVQDTITYGIQVFTNNKTNFTIQSIALINGSFTQFLINSNNLTVGQTWKAQVWINDGTSNSTLRNTSELEILSTPIAPGNLTAFIPNNNTLFVELGTAVNISANMTNNGVICIDVIGHPAYNLSYKCGNSITSFNFNVSFFRRNTFNTTTNDINRTLTFSGQGNLSIGVLAHQYDIVDNMSINITGNLVGSVFPETMRLYVNNTLSNTFSFGTTLRQFSDGQAIKNVSFQASESKLIGYIKIPKLATITTAYVNLTGHVNETEYRSSTLTTVGYLHSTGADDSCNGGSVSKVEDNNVMTLHVETSVGGSGNCERAYAEWDISSIPDNTTVTNVNLTLSRGSIQAARVCDITHYSGNRPSTSSASLLYDRINKTEPYLNDDGNCSVAYTGAIGIQVNLNPFAVTRTMTLMRTVDYWDLGLRFDDETRDTAQHTVNFQKNGTLLINYNGSVIDPYLEVGTVAGVRDWNWSGNFKQYNNKTNNLASAISNYTSTCSPDSDGNCLVPIYVAQQGASIGIIQISDIRVTYTQLNQVQLNLRNDLIRSFLGNSTNHTTIPITVFSSGAVTLNFTLLKYDYAGGNATYTFKAHNEDYTINNTMNMTLYYSGFNYAFPKNIRFMEFIPKNNMSKNVTPFGQTIAKPIFNITTTNYGNRVMNFTVLLNETFPLGPNNVCVNMTVSTNGLRSSGQNLGNNTWIQFNHSMQYQTKFGLWFWADFNCNQTTWRLWQPALYFRGCANGTLCSAAVVD